MGLRLRLIFFLSYSPCGIPSRRHIINTYTDTYTYINIYGSTQFRTR